MAFDDAESITTTVWHQQRKQSTTTTDNRANDDDDNDAVDYSGFLVRFMPFVANNFGVCGSFSEDRSQDGDRCS